MLDPNILFKWTKNFSQFIILLSNQITQYMRVSGSVESRDTDKHKKKINKQKFQA